MQLLTVKIGRGLFDLNLDLVDAALNRICIARAIHDDGVQMCIRDSRLPPHILQS